MPTKSRSARATPSGSRPSAANAAPTLRRVSPAGPAAGLVCQAQRPSNATKLTKMNPVM